MKAFLSKATGFLSKVQSLRVQLVALGGAALVSVGVGMIFLPAGVITGGVFLILAAVDSRS